MKKLAILVSCLVMSWSFTAYAQVQADPMVFHVKTAHKKAKVVHLRHLKPHKKKVFLAPLPSEKNYSMGIIPFKNSATSVDLGMGNVPVLDQGEYGTCVTFSSTAAMDAALSLGDYISQECSLLLDNSLGQNFWEGADFPSQIIAPLNQYGIVSKQKCPYMYGNYRSIMSIASYQKLAVKGIVQYKLYNPVDLATIRAVLRGGHRLAMATMLMANSFDRISVQGYDIKINGVRKAGGLWACNQSPSRRLYCGNSNAGHEIVVIGYDDNQKLLKIRNSWGADVGDSGDFYMTYTFFMAMVSDATEIYPLLSSPK